MGLRRLWARVSNGVHLWPWLWPSGSTCGRLWLWPSHVAAASGYSHVNMSNAVHLWQPPLALPLAAFSLGTSPLVFSLWALSPSSRLPSGCFPSGVSLWALPLWLPPLGAFHLWAVPVGGSFGLPLR